jgi:hypothetical protein
MSFGFDNSALFQAIRELEMLAKARIARRRNGVDAMNGTLTQLARYGVCTCSCHFTANTVHSGEPCCANGTLA